MSSKRKEGDMDGKFSILLCNTKGRTREKGLQRAYNSLGMKHSSVTVYAGTLLVPVHEGFTLAKSLGRDFKVLLKPFESEGVEVECFASDVRQISYDVLNLLAPIPTCEDRLRVFLDGDSNTGWLTEGLRMRVGDQVDVKLRGHPKDVLGVVRYKGLFPKEACVTGTHFGVELLYNPGEGNTDGFIHGRRLFDCPADSGIFVPLNKIRRKISSITMATSESGPADGASFYSARPSSPSVTSLKAIPNCSLEINDRVIWMSDKGPEEGTVKWIGELPGSRKKEITVGVEFDNPVGSGTGKYKEMRLFYATLNHASLVPILGLIKKEEFLSPGMTSANKDDELLAAQAESQRLYDQQRLHSMEERGRASPVRNQPVPGRSRQPRDMTYLEENTYRDIRTQDPTMSSSEWSCRPPSMTEKPDPDPELDVGSLVEVLGNPPVYGVIRWIGTVPDQKDPLKQIAGLEMEEEISAGTDGTFNDIRFFICPMRRAFFVPLYKCRKDKRFVECEGSTDFGSMETPDVSDNIPPPSSLNESNYNEICGKNRGIQGHHNSCYLDATLFAMFYFTTVFDSIFYRKRKPDDLPEYEEVQRVLKEGIVNPLRMKHYVRADKVMKLRALLDKLSSVRGLLSEEKDPEEFLNSLLTQIMQADPFLKLRSESAVSESYYYQLFIEQNEKIKSPTTQNLLELSFMESNIKLAETPSCLILQMPRFGKSYKMFDRILPSLELDITNILENAPRECVICGDLAAFECKDCYKFHNAHLNTFCQVCNTTNHKHSSRLNHKPKPLQVSEDFRIYWQQQQHKHEIVAMPQRKMELFAVVCIETSHYVSFVKAGTRWVFFDSMADRKGAESGYNIPEVVEVLDLPDWLSSKRDIDNYPDDRELPEHIRRLVCDAYMCIYQSTDVMMFK